MIAQEASLASAFRGVGAPRVTMVPAFIGSGDGRQRHRRAGLIAVVLSLARRRR
ncbi:hypothetical protein M8494_15050 [Serratia ureilytica]